MSTIKYPGKLSALDTGILTHGKTASQGLSESRALIQELETLGYHRFWLSEHHESHYSWTRPSLVVPYLAAQTSSIRVGTAAVLLGLCSPLQAAEDYRTLEVIFPGRIDYGVCSAIPQCNDSRIALLNGNAAPIPELLGKFESKLVEMQGYLHNLYDADHRFAYGATPCIQRGDATWIMGTGMGSAILAARHSCALSYSLFHKRSSCDPAILEHYAANYTPNVNRPAPLMNIAISVISAETHEKAKAQKEWVESVQSEFKVNVFGTHEECADQIYGLTQKFQSQHCQVADAVIYMMWHTYKERLEGYKEITKYFKMNTTAEQAVQPALSEG